MKDRYKYIEGLLKAYNGLKNDLKESERLLELNRYESGLSAIDYSRERVGKTNKKYSITEMTAIHNIDQREVLESRIKVHKMQLSIIENAISYLPKDESQVITLYYIKGLTHEQIGERMGKSSGHASRKRREGLRKLSNML
mgnify:CR=1 FL=1